MEPEPHAELMERTRRELAAVERVLRAAGWGAAAGRVAGEVLELLASGSDHAVADHLRTSLPLSEGELLLLAARLRTAATGWDAP